MAEAGECWGPLHGVPCTVKECFGIAGVVTCAGIERLKEYRPKQDAVVVAKLKAAGAIILGKTNVPVSAPALADASVKHIMRVAVRLQPGTCRAITQYTE